MLSGTRTTALLAVVANLAILAPAGAVSAGAQAVPAGAASGAKKAPASRRSGRRPAALRPLVPTTPLGVAALAADLELLLNARATQGAWGVVVQSVTSGETLFSRNADVPLRPASTQKLFTTALAFERLGVAHQFTTEVARDGDVSPDGVLHGSLVLRGGGDPSLSARFFGGQPEAPARALARLVSAAGIRRVEGDVVGDASAFDDRLIPEGWLARYLGAAYAARVSALSLNGNLLHVAINPATPGKAGKVSLRPALSGIKVINTSRTVGGSSTARLAVSRRRDGAVVVSGRIGSRAGVRVYTVVVDQPEEFATRAFARALEDEGIVVTGSPRLGVAPATATRVGVLASPPLAELANIMNGESDNHFAELIFRNAARGAGGAAGSAALGNRQLGELLALRAGVPPNAVSTADGSGLSSFDRVTARALTQLLAFAHRAPWTLEFHHSLPVAGRTETLRRRMIGTPAMGNLHGKTGTTADVVSLAGYANARDGELLAFSFVYNGREGWKARETIDAMGATLAGFSR